MEEGGPHLAIMGCRMVFGMIFGQVGWSGTTKHVKLALPHTIFNPAETHDGGFGAFMLDGIIGDDARSGVVSLESGCRLWVDHLLRGTAKRDGGL